MEFPFITESYVTANSAWPHEGKHILASYNQDVILVYQAYKPSIGTWIAQHQTFEGCPGFSLDRMTWIKPNFLWMMYRSGWASKENQETILAIAVKRSGFEEMLRHSKRHGADAVATVVVDNERFGSDDVRIQWDPDHDPFGNKLARRAIQLGLRGSALRLYVKEWIVSVKDVTEFVRSQHKYVTDDEIHLLQVPAERIYEINDIDIKNHINLDNIKPDIE